VPREQKEKVGILEESMSTVIQPELIPATDSNWKKEEAIAPITPMSLMQIALETGKAEQLQILQEMYFKDMARKAEIEFNLAMNAVQQEIGRIAPNLTNPQTKSRYASYDKLDSVLRPIYTRHGFSLSFSTDPSVGPEVEMVRVVCYVSHSAGHTRPYHYDMPADGKGAKGGDVMTKTHARGSAGSYGMRYLLKMIFNIAIGEDDNDGNGPGPRADQDELAERLAHFKKCETFPELEEHYRNSYLWAKKAGDQRALDAIVATKNSRKTELRKAGAQ
jgi:ERF superfamily protein